MRPCLDPNGALTHASVFPSARLCVCLLSTVTLTLRLSFSLGVTALATSRNAAPVSFQKRAQPLKFQEVTEFATARTDPGNQRSQTNESNRTFAPSKSQHAMRDVRSHFANVQTVESRPEQSSSRTNAHLQHTAEIGHTSRRFAVPNQQSISSSCSPRAVKVLARGPPTRDEQEGGRTDYLQRGLAALSPSLSSRAPRT